MEYRCQRPVTGLLPAARLLYLGVQVLRLEAIVLHLEGKCLSGTGFAVLILGLFLGLGSHIASIAVIARVHAAVPTRKSTGAPLSGGFQGASPPWLQPLVVPLSMAGLVLELLSGAPPAALAHDRTLAVMLLLSIALQRDPLWEVLPQLAAALALDFAAFLAASLTGRYGTPQAVVQHLLSTTVTAVAVIALTPLSNSLMPMAAPEAHQPQQQGRLATRKLMTEIGDPTVLEQPIMGLPQDVIQVPERRLLRVYRRKLCCERVASGLLTLIGAVRGPTVKYSIAIATSPALAADAAGAILPPMLRARAAAASLALITSSTLLLLNGLLAQLPGRLYDEHSASINSVVTALHALGHVMHVLAFAPAQRSRALLVRMMAALTSNLIANEDPWVAFLAQLLALLGLVTALDVRVGWKAAAGGTGEEEEQACRRMDHRQTFADAAGMDGGCAASLGTNARPGLLPGRQAVPFQRQRVALEWICANVAAATCTANDTDYGKSHIMTSPSLLPIVCYVLIAVSGAVLCFSLARGKYLHFYRLHRKFYLPSSYGGMCVTAPLPHDDVLQLRDGGVLDSTPASESNASSATLTAVYSPPPQSVDISARSLASRDSSRWSPNRRSVSLNTIMGTGDFGVGRGYNAAGATASAISGHSHSLLLGTATASTLSSMASERITSSALDSRAYRDRRPPLQNMSSPITSVSVALLEPKGTGGSGGRIATVAGGGEVLHASRSTAPDDGDSAAAASGSDAYRPILASALNLDMNLDEADVISGKLNVTRQLSKLAARGGTSMGARERDRLMQSIETSNPTSSSANTSGLGGSGLGGNNPMDGSAAGIGAGPGHGHGHPPTRSLPSRCSSDISYLYGTTGKAHTMRITTPGGAGSGTTASGAATAGGSFLESVAASLASEEIAAAGVASGGRGYSGFGVPSGGQHQRVNRLRAAPARASSDLAAGRRSFHIQVATQNQPQAPSPYTLQLLQPHAALAQHRPPRHSPSDISYPPPSYHRNAKSLAGHPGTQAPPQAASSRYGQGAAMSPSGQRAGATGAQAGGTGATATTQHPPGVWVATATGTPSGASYGYDGGLRAASFNAAMSPGGGLLASGMRGYVPQRRGPSRQPSRQYTAMMDSTGLALLGQNLITIGGNSGDPNHGILSALHSPNVSGVNAVSGVSGAAHAAIIATAVFSGESNVIPQVMSLWEGPGGTADADPFVAVSSLEPVRGLRPNRGQRLAPYDSSSSTAGTPTANASRAPAFPLAGGGGGPSAVGAVPLNVSKSTAPSSSAVVATPSATGVPGAMPSVAGEIITAKVQVSTVGADVSSSATRVSPTQTPVSTRLLAPQMLIAPVPWQQQEQQHQREQQQQQQQQQQQMAVLGPQSEEPSHPSARSDTEPLIGSSLSFRRDCHDALLPHSSTPGDSGNGAVAAGVAADTTSIRNKMGVSWSDMEARGSGGSTNTLLTTASEASKTSAAGTDPTAAAAADVFSARWPRANSGTGSGSGAGTTEAPEPSPSVRQVGLSRATGVGPPPQLSATASADVIAPVTEGAAPSPVGAVAEEQQQQQEFRNTQVHPHRVGPKTHPQQCDVYLKHRQSGGGATSSAAQPHPTGMLHSDGARGSGEQSYTSMAVELEHVRAARELAAMWTSSSMGDVSSQMVLSNQSSVATGTPPPHGAAAFAAATLAGYSGATVAAPMLTPYDGAPRGLGAVKEASESAVAPPEASDRIRSTRRRRLSQVINPGHPVGVQRSGGRAVQPQQLQQRLRDLEALPAFALSVDGVVDSVSVQSSGGSGVMLSGPMAAAALAAQMSHAAGGGSVSSLAGAASTAMSFDNWATADDLAAMLLGSAGGGAGASVGDLSAPYSPVGSFTRRSLGPQASRLGGPSLPLEQQTIVPDEATREEHPAHAGRGIGWGTPRVPQRIPSAPGPRYNDSGDSDSRDSGANGGGGNNVADISVVMDHTAGTTRGGPLGAAAAAAVCSGVRTMGGGMADNTVATLGATGAGTLRHFTQMSWAEADQVMPLRSPSVPNMGRIGARGLHSGSLRRTSSMGRSRLGSMSSVSSSTLGFLNVINTAFTGSPTPGTAAPSVSQHIGQIPTTNVYRKFLPPPTVPAAAADSAATVGGRNGGRSTPQLLLRGTFGQMLDSDLSPGALTSASPSGWEGDTIDSYAHLPPMRASQTQLALLLPASSLRSGAGRPRGGGGGSFGAVGGMGGGGSIARGLAAAGATMSGPVGWVQDATMQAPVRRVPFRRSSLDERLFKQVMTARLLNMPVRSRGRRRSVGNLTPLEYIPSRLSQDGKAVRAAAQAIPCGPAPSFTPSSTEAGGLSRAAQGLGPLADSGTRPQRRRSLGAIPELHVHGWDVAQGLGPGDGAPLGGGAQVTQAPAATPDNHRLSVAGSVATTITASSTSLQSFADVALCGVHYY
ncbi:hypothetical protein VaNZ11_014335 [Volvox africanus]|uniref:Guanylate cyclase domain-containing protein n=1 Tax=Volvox africanus TaxID=51714 RepID=A0ABQ5SI74_9CHLO|nr:hypothetical protein VaNZ11_014335 [Volvox africanus]